MATRQVPDELPSAWGKNALRGKPVQGGMTMEGMSTPLYDPRTMKFIGWEDQSGRQMALPSQGLVPDYFNPQAAQGAQAAQPVAGGTTPSYYPSAQGPAVTAQGPDVTAQGPAATAQGPTAAGVGGNVNMNWDEVAGALGMSSADIAEFMKQGLSPQDVMNRYNPQPETRALQQMAAIDPATEALRQQLATSYAAPLAQAGAPSAAQFRSYLDLYRQIDPASAAAREALGRGVSGEYALGSRLDPGTIREVEQGVRSGQAARGNVYGTPQLVAETMARGQMGEQRKQQRMQNLASYLQSGISPGDVALNLYNQQQQQLRASQGAALGYLGSGQTPYQTGASYYDRAQAAAAMAAQGGPQYNPQALGQNLTGSAQQFPQYGLNIGQQANQWYNSLAAYGGAGGPTKNRTGAALGGAASGALSGATAGAALGGPYAPVTAAIGGVLGGALGGAGGYFSAPDRG